MRQLCENIQWNYDCTPCFKKNMMNVCVYVCV